MTLLKNMELVVTEDGSHTIFRKDLNETYHSLKGSLGESKHVFMEAGFRHFIESSSKKSLSILEVGMGTGLNVLLTTKACQEVYEIHYLALEPNPLPIEIWSNLNFGEGEDLEVFEKIHAAEWQNPVKISPNFLLEKSVETLEEFDSEEVFDIIFFDAFAPSKQPEIWVTSNLQKCFDKLSHGGILVTYCARGQFKRDLKEVGFDVETLLGAMGKKEMVRASKP